MQTSLVAINFLRFMIGFAAAIQLAACASQPADKVQISIGTSEQKYASADPFVALYIPYAKMSAIAYTDAEYLDENHCPAFDQHPPRNEDNQTLAQWVKSLNVSGWRCLFGRRGALSCPQRYSNCHPVEGLELHVWRRGDCGQIVIAFKGTDPNEIGDWVSNLRWFIRFPPRFDEYDQITAHIFGIIEHVRQFGCRNATIIAVGHSLGGGLAQHAAYATGGKISYVYTFDPSPVTGYFDFAAALRQKSTYGLGIDRAYEEGEILAIPRAIAAGFFPPKSCDPRVRTVRFNVISRGSLLEQHRINDLTSNMISLPKPPIAPPLPLALRDARRCNQTIRG